MTDDYCKLASGIILSTIWREDDHTRLLWITMLAVKGRDHRVRASVPGLAAVANIPLASCRAALVKLMEPDPDSRTKEHEGRRIAVCDDGWLVLNGEKYRNFLSKQERNEYQARLMADRRAAAKAEKLAPVSRKLAGLGQAEAEAEAEAEEKEDESSFCAEPEEPAAAPVMVFPCVGKPMVSWPLLPEKLEEWQESYPDMDVLAACRQARQWCIDHTAKRKTFKGMTRFLGDWIGRAQNRGDHRKTETQPTTREIAYWQAPNPSASFHDELIETLTAGAEAGNPDQARMLAFIQKHQ